MPVSLAGSSSASMHGALVPIAYRSLTSAAFIDIINIPQTYQDLRIVLYARSSNSSGSGDTLRLYVDQGSGFQYSNIYSSTHLKGDGSTASSFRQSNNNAVESVNAIPTTSQTSGIFAAFTFDILNYRGSTNKTFLYRTASDWNGSGQTVESIALVRNTAAITGFQFATSIGGNHFAAGTTVAIYGIRSVGQ
jgi:hypothetical protein